MDRFFLCFIYCKSRDWIQSRAFDRAGTACPEIRDRVEIVGKLAHVYGFWSFRRAAAQMVIQSFPNDKKEQSG
jgi:hypothetical protein